MIIVCVLALVARPKAIPPGVPGFDATTVAFVEGKLANWKPGSDDRAEPDPALWVKNAALAGRWSTDHYMSGSTISLSPTGATTFSVDFSTAGCLSAWKLKRTANFVNGALVFDRPIEEYDPFTFDRLYPVRLADSIRLIAPCQIRKKWFGDGKDVSALRMFTFAMVSSDPNSNDLIKDGKILRVRARR